MSTEHESYLHFLESLGKTLEALTVIAREKTAAVCSDNLAQLDACIKKEQALSLTLRSMDRKRDTMLEQLGLSNVSLSKLAQHYPESLQATAKAVTETLGNQYSIYLSASETARTTLECNLHQIEQVLDGQLDSPRSSQPPEAMKADFRA